MIINGNSHSWTLRNFVRMKKNGLSTFFQKDQLVIYHILPLCEVDNHISRHCLILGLVLLRWVISGWRSPVVNPPSINWEKQKNMWLGFAEDDLNVFSQCLIDHLGNPLEPFRESSGICFDFFWGPKLADLEQQGRRFSSNVVEPVDLHG